MTVSGKERVTAAKALYIKLGEKGSWEKECINDGIVRFGYAETPIEVATAGDWDAVRDLWRSLRTTPGAATRDVTQIRNFFEAPEDVLWITFHANQLWWCFAKPGVVEHPDGKGTYRKTRDGWHCSDVDGKKLTTENISGALLKVQAFRGTICDVSCFDYLLRKLNCELLPEVTEAFEAERRMVQAIVPLMRLLTWPDFELLVELVFANSGWRRLGKVGGDQKHVDIELLLPSTQERAFIQIKSSTDKSDLAKYSTAVQKHGVFDRMFFVWHSGRLPEDDASADPSIALIGPSRLARMVFDAGLTSWLREKVS